MQQANMFDLQPVEIVTPRGNPQVSVDAYHSGDRTAQRVLVERFVAARGEHGAIPDEADEYFRLDPPRMWRRFGEMRKTGVLRLHPDGLERETRLGQKARVHVWVPPEERVVPKVVRKDLAYYREVERCAVAVIAATERRDGPGLKAAIAALDVAVKGANG